MTAGRAVIVATMAIAAVVVGSLPRGSVAQPGAEPGLDPLAFGSWQKGRATFYGRDAFSIDAGHCMYGEIPHPKLIAALSIWPGFGFGGNWRYTACGTCYEIQCNPNGEQWSHTCRGDRNASSIIVQITDKCPGGRWCGGDYPHFDLSYEAFGEIGAHHHGVLSLWWRPIQCPPSMGRGGELALEPSEYKPYCRGRGEEDVFAHLVKRNLTTFAEALWRSGVHAEVAPKDDESPGRLKRFTLLAPTNRAFERAASERGVSVDELLSDLSSEVVRQHILPSPEQGEGQQQTLRGGVNVTIRTHATATDGQAEAQEAWRTIDGGFGEVAILDAFDTCNGEIDVLNALLD